MEAREKVVEHFYYCSAIQDVRLPFRSRTIGTDRVHVADEDVSMLVVVYNRVISKDVSLKSARVTHARKAANLFL
jgi:hypothetical protein